ncbi:sigma 54-interacting transcriptional regulator [Botrimarina hoheduenensis]|uniref:Transcriptional regulatory protein ZraR n=1 Tax=Botrimarina hoheduenensis TaxID=2528000 RepID=A0A5C5VV10_9BACT|nr:sigma 54-interacting transcriptional regulator [Botrimarina hoheduenensis]TWT41441.1 Transcriptional regulatory protein ZraR [Botrimarina hoheduenensis]
MPDSAEITAYLVIREGSKWTDVFRLLPGEAVTIGRAPTNRVVVKDERCSRNHSEVFSSAGEWVLRDLESRNGTTLNGTRIGADQTLKPGDIIRVGNVCLAFVDDLQAAFPDSQNVLRASQRITGSTDVGLEAVNLLLEDKPGEGEDDASIFEADQNEPTHITHRRDQSRYLGPVADDESSELSGVALESAASTPKVGRAAAMLCRLAFDLAKAGSIADVARTALDGLFSGTAADAGAILLMRSREATGENTDDLVETAARSDTTHRYHRVSRFLASTVLRERQGVLARNIMDDSQLGARDSSGDILATSVLCVPIRHESGPLGLVHLYATDAAKPLDPDDLEFSLAVGDTVAVALKNLERREALAENLDKFRDENTQLREQLGVQSEIVGGSEAIKRVTRDIARAAPSRATVLICGESGVGKELVARAVHYSSPRSKGPFVCLNCAALTESLLESELFGHEKGAFTGATDRKMGKFEAASGGTLMLDEIGEMSPTIQAKFLRVLEGHAFERVGGSKPISVDVRVIAATNRDLEQRVAEGAFRRDLYFRLHVLEITVPPLRKRPEDIPLLAEHFLERYNAETARKIEGFSTRAMEAMLTYRWPGNVREMKNVIERAVVLCPATVIDVDDLVLSTLKTSGDTEAGQPEGRGGAYEAISLAEIERRHILATLKSTGWNKSRAANILGIERSTLDRKIRRYQLSSKASSA